MRAFSVFSAALLFVASASAATITDPPSNATWDASTLGQNVAWTSVSTDPTSFTLALANMQVYPNINVILKRNVSTAPGSTTVDGPPSGWPTGNGFTINIIQENGTTGSAILAQSQQFNINGTTKPFSSSSLSLSSTGTGTGSSPSSTQSGGSTGGAMGLTVQAGFIAGLGLVGALLA